MQLGKYISGAQTIFAMFCFFKYYVENDLANAFVRISFMTNNKSVKNVTVFNIILDVQQKNKYIIIRSSYYF